MTRSVAVSVENNFTKGLITEVTGVNSPENSVTETTNVVYDRRGRAISREGFAYEEDAVQQNIPHTGVRNEFLWETVAENNSQDFVVVQLGSTIRFFEVTGDASLSSGLKSFSVNLLTYKVSLFTDAQVRDTLCSFTSGKGYLFIAHPFCDTIYVDYDETIDNITTNSITIQIRDFEGVVDNLGIDVRPTTLSTAHKYNLFNQSWYADVRFDGDSTAVMNALQRWDDLRSDFPANSDVWWYYTQVDSNGQEYFNATRSVNSRTGFFGNTPAAKGHYIINALETNRSTLSGIPGVAESSSGGLRPAIVAFFAGRTFFAGVGKSGFSSTVYFSQIVERDDQFGKCYQTGDPTSKDNFDLLPSDGGTVKIQDINTVIDLKVIGQALYIFATNGVWSISGTDTTPFRATDYTVTKISSFPAISKTSIVDVGGIPLWWNYEGIFTLNKSEIGLTSEVTNLTQTTIQQFYDAIPQTSKLTAKGSFNDQSGLVYWLYNVLPDEGTYKYTNILVFDALSTAFYPFTIPDTSREISGIVSVRDVGAAFTADNVIRSTLDNVVTGLGDQITVDIFVGMTARSKIFKLLTVNGNAVSFAEISDTTYLDWGTEAYTHYFVTGYRIRGDLLKKFQTNYLTVITEDLGVGIGSCYVQGVWDYAFNNDSGRYSNPQQVYRNRLLRSYQRSRLKIRGTGFSLQFKFFGEAGKPFSITGWAGLETGNNLP